MVYITMMTKEEIIIKKEELVKQLLIISEEVKKLKEHKGVLIGELIALEQRKTYRT